MNTTLAIQSALKAMGYDPGPIDGVMGRLTRLAINKYRAQMGMDPGAIDTALINALILEAPPPAPITDAEWYRLAWRKLGQHESLHKDRLWRFLKFGGNSVGDPSRIPWCGDFVESCLAVTLPDEALPANPYQARSWARFGIDIKDQGPRLGAVMVFYRGDPDGWQGHVGFYNGESKHHYSVLGGNQSNRVTVANLNKKRLLAIRWPASFPYAGPAPRQRVKSGDVSTDEA